MYKVGLHCVPICLGHQHPPFPGGPQLLPNLREGVTGQPTANEGHQSIRDDLTCFDEYPVAALAQVEEGAHVRGVDGVVGLAVVRVVVEVVVVVHHCVEGIA